MTDRLPSCPLCGGRDLETFFRVDAVPVHQNLLWRTRESARHCDRGEIALALCTTCGFISNAAFQPALVRYSPLYENSQSCSPQFHAYMEGLADRLIERYGLREKVVVEIGCGKGEFLSMLCERGGNRGIGFDPSVPPDRPATDHITFISDFYSERYAGYRGDLVCCRHVLEHLPDPAAMLTRVRRSIGEHAGTAVYVEVPSAIWILRNLTFWDIFYEHCSYFSPGSLRWLFAACGLRIVALDEVAGGQYLGVEAIPDGDGPAAHDADGVRDAAESVAHFVAHYPERLAALRAQTESLRRDSRRAVVWGAGAKGVTFLNVLAIQPEFIPYVVDINPRKQGMYVPGTGQQIVHPERLRAYAPDVIFVMNPNYREEISEMVRNAGASGEIVSL